MNVKYFLILFLNCVSLQKDLSGKIYKALIAEDCKEMPDGGCMIYTYRILNFKKDSVIVSSRVIAKCTPKEIKYNYSMNDNPVKTFRWNRKNDTITIEGFNEYGKLIFQNSKLIGENKIVFEEEIK